MIAYYNEIDPKAAAWLRELIRRGLTAPGDVDERSIEDVTPDDLRPYTQCHFFAGIGVWSYSLRLAGWPDDQPIWTGSCPCQPFSAAGKSGGFADERHLWPAMHWLIQQCRPDLWFGEQVASKDGLNWLDLVCDDLEASGYAVGAVDTSSALTGAPHIRQRLRIGAAWAEHASRDGWRERRAEPSGRGLAGGCRSGGLADAHGRYASAERQQRGGEQRQQQEDGGDGFGLADTAEFRRIGRRPSEASAEPGTVERSDGLCAVGVVEHATGDGRIEWRPEPSGRGIASGCGIGGLANADDARPQGRISGRDGAGERLARASGVELQDRPAGEIDRFWRDADWLFCRGGKWRPVEPGTFPLVDGAPARVGRLRGYGNAVDAIATAHFIAAFDEALSALRPGGTIPFFTPVDETDERTNAHAD